MSCRQEQIFLRELKEGISEQQQNKKNKKR